LTVNNFKNILVIQTAFIGDAILATAVLEKLHNYYPDAKLSFLVRKGNENLFANHPFLTETLVWNKIDSKYSSFIGLLKKIRANKYDLVVNLHRFASSGILTAFSGAKTTVGFDKNPFSHLFSTRKTHSIGGGFHEVGRNHQLISSFTDEHPARPALYSSPAQFEKVKEFKKDSYVCMAPASVWYTKQWPEERWVELCKQIDTGKIFLLGGPTDRLLCARIIAASGQKNIVNLAGELSMLESAALMKDARMNYVNDSGPMHLASAVNAPVTAIYCSTVPEFGFFPLSEKSFIIEADTELDCRPCGLHGFKKCPDKHFKCGMDISAQQVLNAKSYQR
jgi:ADP-heptose:LPS heptosyltransferase